MQEEDNEIRQTMIFFRCFYLFGETQTKLVKHTEITIMMYIIKEQ